MVGLSGSSHIAGQDEEEESRRLVNFPPDVFLPLPHPPPPLTDTHPVITTQSLRDSMRV